MANVDLFLKIDGVQGESQDSKHKGEIELESFSWGDAQVSAQRDGGGAGRAAFKDFQFVMRVNKASPQLFLASASGQHLKMAVLTARRAGGAGAEFLTFKFTDLLVSSYQTEGSAEQPFLVDQVAFNFGRIDVEYRPQKPDGTLDVPIKASWDVKSNRPGT
jgi:type VI secretion system secreted protein Hcp